MFQEFLNELLQLQSPETAKRKLQDMQYERDMQLYNQQVLKKRLEEMRHAKTQEQTQVQVQMPEQVQLSNQSSKHGHTAADAHKKKQNGAVNYTSAAEKKTQTKQNGHEAEQKLIAEKENHEFIKAELRDLTKADLRRAVLMSEILDRPVSQRKRSVR